MTATPLQLANAYLAIARGGVRKQITLLAEEETSTIRVMSEQTASQLTAMLAEVIADGTGSRAHIDGYSVAGKTGTGAKNSARVATKIRDIWHFLLGLRQSTIPS